MFTKRSMQETGDESICMVIRRLESEFRSPEINGLLLIYFLDSAGGSVHRLIILCKERWNQGLLKDLEASLTMRRQTRTPTPRRKALYATYSLLDYNQKMIH